MKKFFEFSKAPIVVGTTAAVLYAVDSLIAPRIVAGASFMWVAFAAWTIMFVMSMKDRVRALIGMVIGFAAAVGMIYFGQLFDTSAIGINIAGLIGVFIFNAAVMYFDNFKKYWMGSVTGIFMGILLTFSGLGVGMGVDTWAGARVLLGTMMLYAVLGTLCAFASAELINKWKRKRSERSENN